VGDDEDIFLFTANRFVDPGGQIAGRLGVAGIPATFIVDTQGVVRYRLVGGPVSAAEILHLVQKSVTGVNSGAPASSMSMVPVP
jgi:hypothetical protein